MQVDIQVTRIIDFKGNEQVIFSSFFLFIFFLPFMDSSEQCGSNGARQTRRSEVRALKGKFAKKI